MNTALSDALKETRSVLRGRARLRLFMLPCEVRRLVSELNTFVALAEDLEDDLHLAELRERRDRALGSSRVVRFPMATLVVAPDDGNSTP